MSAARLLGLILVVAGALTFVFRGFSYTEKEKVLDIGPIEATAEQQKHVAIPLWIGGVLVGAGFVLFLLGGQPRKG